MSKGAVASVSSACRTARAMSKPTCHGRRRPALSGTAPEESSPATAARRGVNDIAASADARPAASDAFGSHAAAVPRVSRSALSRKSSRSSSGMAGTMASSFVEASSSTEYGSRPSLAAARQKSRSSSSALPMSAHSAESGVFPTPDSASRSRTRWTMPANAFPASSERTSARPRDANRNGPSARSSSAAQTSRVIAPSGTTVRSGQAIPSPAPRRLCWRSQGYRRRLDHVQYADLVAEGRMCPVNGHQLVAIHSASG